MRPPGRNRILLAQASRVGDGIPQPLDVGLAEDGGRPAGVGVGDDDPVDQPLVGRLDVALGQLPHPGLADPGAVEIGQQLRLRVADELDQRPARAAPRWSTLASSHGGVQPGVSSSARLDPRPPDVLVGIVDVDVAGALLVGDPGDLARQWGVLGQRDHPDDLAFADVRAHLDGEAGVALEPLFGRHG